MSRRVPWPWEQVEPREREPVKGDLFERERELLLRVHPVSVSPQDDSRIQIEVGNCPIGDLRRGREGLIRRLREHTGLSYEDAYVRADKAIQRRTREEEA